MKYLLFAALLVASPVIAAEKPTTCAHGAQACFAKPGTQEFNVWWCGTYKDKDKCDINSGCAWRGMSCQAK